MKVAALYVDPKGPYPRMEGVEAWDVARDATQYTGPFPVVAHPPCGPWSVMRHLHTRPEERPLAIRAVRQVRTYGGVLEHPKGSRLFHEYLPLPGRYDGYGGYTIEVVQCDWGHPARKRTWLYIVGVPRAELPTMPPPREPTHWASGSRTAKRGAVPIGIKVCSAEQRRRTPPDFAAWLVEIARRAGTRKDVAA